MEQIRFYLFKKMDQRDFLVTQWIGICLLTQRIQVWSPVPEDPTCCRTSKPLLHTHRGRAPRARGAWSPCSTPTRAVLPGPEEPEAPAPHPPGPCTQGQRSLKSLLHTHQGRAPRARGARSPCSIPTGAARPGPEEPARCKERKPCAQRRRRSATHTEKKE